MVLPSKKNLHISFTPLSNGSSVFTTDNEGVQKAIESHYRFGSLFRLYSEETQSEVAEAEAADIPDEKESSDDGGLTEVTVSDIASAKNYLADKYNISRTLLRNTKSIMDQASAHGIRFVGL